MRKEKYGRIINTGSPVGFFGAPNSSHYSTAKMASFGLTQCLAIEGQDNNIFANLLAPVSASEMTKEYFPEEWLSAAKPNYIAEAAAWLAHESCIHNGAAFEVGGGFIHKIRLEMGRGIQIEEVNYSAEAIAQRETQLANFEESLHPAIGQFDIVVGKIFERMAKAGE